MVKTQFIRTAGYLCVIAALIEIVGGIAATTNSSLSNPASSTFAYSQTLFTITGLIFFVSVVGLVLTGAAGNSWLAKIGLGLALLGRLIFIPAELLLLFQYETGQVLLGICTPLIGIGMVLAGISVLMAGRWQGWSMFTPLLCGLYTFVILLPAFALNGGPSFLAIGGWGICWLLLGLALANQQVKTWVTQPGIKVLG